MTFEEFADALSRTESNNNDRAYGDEGLALGRWQMHPAWFFEWQLHTCKVDDSWFAVFRAALENFFKSHKEQDPVRLAMIFHLGAAAVARGKWDAAYAERFQKCLASK